MSTLNLIQTAETYLDKLCRSIDNRRVGSAGNQAATAFFAKTAALFGFETERPPFDCIDWAQTGAQLAVNGATFAATPSPYSLGGRVSAPLVVAASAAELAAVDIAGKVLLLRGELAKEQLMPKNFPFYNPDEHRHIINLLETRQPAAIISATARNPQIAGGLYPFPLIEDGDFNLPSVYLTEEEGLRLAEYAGQEIVFDSRASRIPATGCNVIARKGGGLGRRVVVCAHIDAKINTPGALDNAAGVITLLLLAELLQTYAGGLQIELVAINGEDYYAAPGELQYLAMNQGQLGNILVAINIDAAGYRQGPTAYSLYNCPAGVTDSIYRVFSAQPELVEGEPWYQSDHSVFIQNGAPAMAITSGNFMELTTYITHTPKDSPELVDCGKLARLALALRTLLLDFDRTTFDKS